MEKPFFIHKQILLENHLYLWIILHPSLTMVQWYYQRIFMERKNPLKLRKQRRAQALCKDGKWTLFIILQNNLHVGFIKKAFMISWNNRIFHAIMESRYLYVRSFHCITEYLVIMWYYRIKALRPFFWSFWSCIIFLLGNLNISPLKILIINLDHFIKPLKH